VEVISHFRNEKFCSKGKSLDCLLFHVVDCTGNVAVGNLSKMLPFVLQEIEKQPKRQYLLLHSLKEVSRILQITYLMK